MTNKIDETVEIPNVNYPDSGTRREAIADGWWWVKISPEDDDEAAWVKDNNVYPSRMDCTAIGPMDAFLRWYPLAQFIAPIPPPASLAAKDEQLETYKKLFGEYAECCQRLSMSVMYEHCKPVSHSWPGKLHTESLTEGVTFLIDRLAAMREAMEKARKAMAALVRWDDVTSNENYDISEEGEQEGLVAACFQIRDALDALNQLDSTTPHAPNDDGLAKLKAVVDGVVDRLPKTADGVPITPPMDVFVLRDADMDTRIEPDKIILQFDSFNGYEPTERAYSTREAAEIAARSEQP